MVEGQEASLWHAVPAFIWGIFSIVIAGEYINSETGAGTLMWALYANASWLPTIAISIVYFIDRKREKDNS